MRTFEQHGDTEQLHPLAESALIQKMWLTNRLFTKWGKPLSPALCSLLPHHLPLSLFSLFVLLQTSAESHCNYSRLALSCRFFSVAFSPQTPPPPPPRLLPFSWLWCTFDPRCWLHVVLQKVWRGFHQATEGVGGSKGDLFHPHPLNSSNCSQSEKCRHPLPLIAPILSLLFCESPQQSTPPRFYPPPPSGVVLVFGGKWEPDVAHCAGVSSGCWKERGGAGG